MVFAMEGAAEFLSLMNGTELLKVHLVQRKAAAPLSVHLRQVGGLIDLGQLRRPSHADAERNVQI